MGSRFDSHRPRSSTRRLSQQLRHSFLSLSQSFVNSLWLLFMLLFLSTFVAWEPFELEQTEGCWADRGLKHTFRASETPVIAVPQEQTLSSHVARSLLQWTEHRKYSKLLRWGYIYKEKYTHGCPDSGLQLSHSRHILPFADASTGSTLSGSFCAKAFLHSSLFFLLIPQR